MKRLIAAALIFSPIPASAQVYVQGHVNNDGSYTPGHWRSSPDSSTANNWSSRPNVNPHTGQQGQQNSVPNRYEPRNPPRYQNSPLPPQTQERWRQTMPLTCKYSDIC